jgi:hypothetical protein
MEGSRNRVISPPSPVQLMVIHRPMKVGTPPLGGQRYPRLWMRRRIEALLYGRRWREDEHAWRVWQGLAPLVPANVLALDSGRPLVGRVERVYLQARRGTKALVHFGAEVGLQDTWWEGTRPPVGRWVVVRTRLWLPPGTHSEEQVVWIDGWDSWAPGDVYSRALRHERRLERDSGAPTKRLGSQP